MIDKLLSAYFLEKGKISPEQTCQIAMSQAKVRVKLGLIAVSEKLMTKEQADEVNKLQAVMDKRFGDIAVEKGYLTDDQVSRLLGLQGNGYLTFIQAITDNGIMTLQEIEDAVAEYQKDNGFTSTDIDSLKSDDADRIVPLFLPQDIDENQKEHILTAFRTVVRLIDNHVTIGKAYKTDKLAVNAFSTQALDGDKKAALAFTGKDNNLLALANTFAGEEFTEVDLDALDACAEFINCVNGMFATKKSGTLNVDMLPPVYKAEASELKGNLVVIPLYVNGQTIELISTFGEFINY